MDRCHLKLAVGDRLHVLLCAAGHNIRWLLRMIAKNGLVFLWRFFGLERMHRIATHYPEMAQRQRKPGLGTLSLRSLA